MYEYKVNEVTKVVDGDTVDLQIDLGFDITKKERVRIGGIDAPESRTRNLEEKKLGLEAKAFVQEQLETAESIIIRTQKTDKYGRILGWLYLNGETVSLNDQMVEAGYAWIYDGGRKEKDLSELEERRRANGTWIEAETEAP